MKGLMKLMIFVFYIFCHFVALSLFARGFFLTRFEIPEHSSRLPTDLSITQPAFNNAIFVLIDSLSFNFTSSPHFPLLSSLYSSSFTSSLSHSTFNSSSSLDLSPNSVKSNSSQFSSKNSFTFLYKFLADPPTTTMQRIKGLMTGGIPTFFEMKENFFTEKIEEDNLLHHLLTSNFSLSFLGDDTWLKLFPTTFHRSVGFESFNVKDLHSCDAGISKFLFREIENFDNSKKNFLVAHFLGVDHIGHSIGKYNAEMDAKLLQMNEMLEMVINTMKNDTLLIVCSDHGMTESGNHGGSSLDEIESVLFLFSKKQFPSSSPPIQNKQVLEQARKEIKNNQVKTVEQIDLVSTVSILMGVPIPFGNLGTVIKEVLDHCFSADPQLTQTAIQYNSEQIIQYLTVYFTNYSTTHSSFASSFFSILQNFKNEESSNYEELNREILRECRIQWNTFEETSMLLGIVIFMFSIFNLFSEFFFFPSSFSSSHPPTRILIILFLILVKALSYEFLFLLLVIIYNLYFVIQNIKNFKNGKDGREGEKEGGGGRVRVMGVMGVVLNGIHIGSLFSNSFMENEQKVVYYLLVSALLILLLLILFSLSSSSSSSSSSPFRSSRSSKPFTLIMNIILLLISLRFSQNLSKSDTDVSFYSILLPFLLIFFPLYSFFISQIRKLQNNHSYSWWMYMSGGMNLSSMILVLCLFMKVVQHIVFPRIVFGLFAVQMILNVSMCFLWKRGAVFLVKGVLVAFIPLLVLILSETLIYNFLFLFVNFSLFISITKQIITSGVLWNNNSNNKKMVIGGGYSMPTTTKRHNNNNKLGLVFYLLTLLHFSAVFHFYKTDHFASISEIPMKAAFIGFEKVNWLFGFLLVSLHVAASHLVSTLVCVVVCVKLKPEKHHQQQEKEEKEEKEEEEERDWNIRCLALWVTLFSLKTLATSVFVHFERRHLMVWRVFAPKFLTDTALFWSIDLFTVFLLFGFFFCYKTHNYTTNYILSRR